MFVLKIILAIAFVLAGGAKVFKAKPMVDQFKEFGLPNFAVQLVGGLEVLGAIGLLVPSLTLYAAIGLVLLMIGAVFNHVKTKHNLPTIAPAFILGVLSSVLIFLLEK